MLGTGIGIGIGPFGGGNSLTQRLSSLFPSGRNGALYDPSDMASLNQLSTGLTPVTAVTQPVGMVLDKHVSDGRGVVNLLTYTEQFDNAAWAKEASTATADAAIAPDGTLTADMLVPTTLNQARYVRRTFTASAQSYTYSVYAKAGGYNYFALYYYNFGSAHATSKTFNLATGAIATQLEADSGLTSTATMQSVGNGWYRCTVTFTAEAGSSLVDIRLYNNTPTVVFVGDGVSGYYLWGAQLEVGTTATAYQVNTNSIGGPGNHALQSTAAARPTWTNRVNLLTATEQFDNAAWTKYNSTIAANTTTAPDGTLTADKLIANTVSGAHYVGHAVGTGLFTVSFYAKAAEYSAVSVATGADYYIHYNLATGVVSSAGTGWASGSMVDVGGGWWRCTAVNAASKNWVNAYIYANNAWQNNGTASGGLIFVGDDTSGIYIWGAQLEVGTASTTYQRVTTATDFGTVGFPYYLSFLGTDDSLSSATGGGGSAGFFWCGVVQPTGGAGTLQTLFADNGTNTGYKVQKDVNNKLSFSAGNNAAFTTKVSTAALSVGTKVMLTVWDDGTNLNVQIGEAAAETVARPVVVAGTAGYTIGKENGGASSFFIGNLYPSVYFRGTAGTATDREIARDYCRLMGGM